MFFKPKTFAELCQSMQTRAEVEINGTVGVINGIAAEDGSGRCWIVTVEKSLHSTNEFPTINPYPRKIFVRE